MRTAAGVFSPERRRPGHRGAAAHAPAPPDHRRAARPRLRLGPDRPRPGLRSPAGDRVWAVDVNERALDLPRHNAAALGPGRRARRAGPRTSRRTCGSPRSGPTRRSGSARRSCTTCCCTWLPRLAAGGAAYLVVQKNLGSDSLQRLAGRRNWPGGSAGQFSVARHRERAHRSGCSQRGVRAPVARPSLSRHRGVPARPPPVKACRL